MATGAPGTNGVWQYGEDDSETTFSALLNKVASTTNTQIGADRARLTSLEARSLAGLIPVVPTGVIISTGTGSANSKGRVTFSGATSVILNGVFTSAAKNYRFIYSITGTSVANDLTIRLCQSGTPNTSANYNRMATITNSNATTGYFVASGDTKTVLSGISNASNTGGGFFDITEPATTSRKTINGIASGYNNSQSAQTSVYGGGTITITAACDGIQLYPSTGNISGEIQVFAYDNS